MKEKGYHIVSGGTDNHMFLIDLRNKNITGKEALAALEQVNITVNKNMVPFDKQSPMVTSGIRIGTAAITSRGFKAEDAVKVVEWIDKLLLQPENEKLIFEYSLLSIFLLSTLNSPIFIAYS
jgi:glycine hydroxymethyltransferase